ncbi:hypothetical protein [Bacillus canaveralius]|uniref:hypothetical protein n=1 Tax=Bacillus canaveralius TaxID=1403243 RepID=UPI000F77358C|nr:hypothetical protein [Bacillus canaveralius]RSK54619.1 hypothetical protein EJA13_04890 [Bacillus canaveralius]
MKLTKATWYSLVLVALLLLIISVIKGSIWIGLISFVLAMFLKKESANIPLPDAIAKQKIYSAAKQEIYEASEFSGSKRD